MISRTGSTSGEATTKEQLDVVTWMIFWSQAMDQQWGALAMMTAAVISLQSAKQNNTLSSPASVFGGNPKLIS
jgi:hypothetical protein